ncbi:helix-turn-helix transcriptional regulator [Nocardia crassostreae]|uniref:helix-turn-helix transcriptional regulator n=1 Tax=Nocardia crassostreae TaxID=53428 RepID=UPI00082F444C|nr:helix-turn-helix transcriptional regulator [Nocardia crassostreae]
MLFGRGDETALVAELLGRSVAGQAATLVIRGEAGIGKSRLLEHAAETATGHRLLRVTGTEAESALPFAGLHALLSRARDGMEVLPEQQAVALRAALDSGGTELPNPFLVGVAALTLLAQVAEQAPLLCLIDDAQWLDRATLDTLLFVARRLDAEPIALVFAIRGDHLPELHDLPGTQLVLRGLDDQAAAALLGEQGGALPPATAHWLLHESNGNPLALQVLPTLRRAEQMYASPFSRATPTPHRIQRAFTDRIRALPSATQDFLLIAAADDTADPTVILSATAQLGAPHAEHVAAAAEDAAHSGVLRTSAGDAALSVARGEDEGAALDWTAARAAMETAEHAELVRVRDGRIVFSHPLIRAAAYESAGAGRRREAHGVLAARLVAAEHVDRRAWHLAAAADAPDEVVAAELEEAGRRAAARGGFAEVTAAYRRAADLTPDAAARGRRLAAAARAAVDAGNLGAATELAEWAAALIAAPVALAELSRLQADIAVEQDRPQAAYQMLSTAATFVAAADPGLAGRLLFDAADAAWSAGDLTAVAQLAARAERTGLPGADRLQAMADLVAGLNPGADADFRRSIAALQFFMSDIAPDQLRERATVAFWHLLIADIPAARDLSAALAEDCRSTGAIGVLTRALMIQARTDLLLGLLTAARTAATEGLRLAADTGYRATHIYQSTTLALLAAIQGDEAACLEFTAEPLARDIAPGNVHARNALSLLDLGVGRPDATVDRVTAVLSGANRSGAMVSIPDLVEAAHRTDRLAEAREPFEWYRIWAAHIDRPWVQAVSHRCRALLSQDDSAETYFAEALRLHNTEADFVFDRARTELLYGEWLRRHQRRAEARPHLRTAAETFARLGATPWAERAEGELRATGETRATAAPVDVLSRLTPKELQTAQLAATGLSNKDIGAQLFLSPRTVGYHLSNAYPKLGITSRRELVTLFQRQ